MMGACGWARACGCGKLGVIRKQGTKLESDQAQGLQSDARPFPADHCMHGREMGWLGMMETNGDKR